MISNISLVLALLAFSAILYRISRIGRRPKDYPPGPPTHAVFGNLLQVSIEQLLFTVPVPDKRQMPTKAVHLQLEEWSRIYGPIYSLMVGSGKVMIILSGNTEVKELLDKRAPATNDRSDRYIGHEILSHGERILLQVILSRCKSCQHR